MEAAVKAIKGMMKKCLQENSNQYLALLELRSTPRQDTASPAQIMFGRTLDTQLPQRDAVKTSNEDRKTRRQETVKRYYDRNARNLGELVPKSVSGMEKWSC